ncbi:CvpA family protein [Rubeoparvulum massiliense]|uniref:CvpA family protein n=1 Tax=Rubeoparvulum massiliense TaxID=1631346 RepID=UPI00065DC02C|nr:CvpA family protein [Rubeoparvulum massiliense]
MVAQLIDIIFLVVVLGYTFIAYQRGFVLQLLRLTSFIISFIVAYFYSPVLIPWLQQQLPLSIQTSQLQFVPTITQLIDMERVIYHGLSFAILFFGTRVVLSVLGYLLDGIMHLPVLSTANHSLGAALGFLEISLFLFIAVNLLVVIPAEWAQTVLQQSSVAQWLLQQTPLFF